MCYFSSALLYICLFLKHLLHWSQQQYLHRQILDLNNKKQQTEFQLDQINASLSVFNNAFINSTKEQADEVLNDNIPEEEN